MRRVCVCVCGWTCGRVVATSEPDKSNPLDETECLWFSNKFRLSLIIWTDGSVVFSGLAIKACIWTKNLDKKKQWCRPKWFLSFSKWMQQSKRFHLNFFRYLENNNDELQSFRHYDYDTILMVAFPGTVKKNEDNRVIASQNKRHI